MSDPLIYRATDDEITLATDWHSGQSSRLYAVASTGALSLGSRRPFYDHMRAMSDAEWRYDLALDLRSEVRDILRAEHLNGGRIYNADRVTAIAWLAKLAPLLNRLENDVDREDTTA